ncbi:MAG TPA: tripartite tricarboxylate transporter substrate-binding protein [Roseomonas sp.]
MRLLRRALLALPASLSRPALAQPGWPSRPIRHIVPFPPGGSIDILSRLIAEQLQQRLGQPVVVENRPGAGGNLGIDVVAKAAPDGYSFGSAPIGVMAINQYLYGRMPFDPERDLKPVSLLWELPNVALVAPQRVPVRTLAEFIAWAKAQPGGIMYGSPGSGTTAHLSVAMLAARTGFQATHVPFRSGAHALPALLAGDVHFMLDNLATYQPMIRDGMLRPLAVSSAERWPDLPEVPTIEEAGVPGFVITVWVNLVAPPGTPDPIVAAVGGALRAAAEDAAVQQRFVAAGARIRWTTPAETAERASRERPMWADAVRMSGVRAD